MTLNNNFLSAVLADVKTTISDEFTHVDFGTGTTTPTAADTAMEASVIRNARQDITTLSNSVIISGFLGSGQANGNTLSEIGVFDAASSGNMQDHDLISSFEKTADKELWVDIRNSIEVTQRVE